jgi:Rad3-related DNA helicase
MIAAPLPSPQELGFAEKFVRFYQDQLTAIDKAVLNAKRFTGLAVPTGGGKSLIGVATALLHPDVKRAVYLTSTKGLQDQAAADFAAVGMVDVRGQRNYPCRAVQPGEPLEKFKRSRFHVGCDEGPCHAGVDCRDAPAKAGNGRRLSMANIVRPRCEYFGAVWDAWRAPLVITNYAMWLAATEYAEGLGEVDLLILDEAHDADKELESFLTMEISLEDAKALSGKLLTHSDTATWRDWARHHLPKLAARIEDLETHPPTDVTGVRDLRQLKGVHGKLERLAKIDPLALDRRRGPAQSQVCADPSQRVCGGVSLSRREACRVDVRDDDQKDDAIARYPARRLAFLGVPVAFPAGAAPDH